MMAYDKTQQNASADKPLPDQKSGKKAKRLPGRALEIEPAIPCAASVDPAELMNDLRQTVLAHCCMSNRAYVDAVVMWILFTYVWQEFNLCPRLGITAPQKRCGKSQLLNVIKLLGDRTMRADNMTPAVFFRVIEEAQPAILIDEAGKFLNEDSQLIGAINSGWMADGSVVRCAGDDHQPRSFSTYAPVAISLIGSLQDEIEDRCILIRMRRKNVDDHVSKIRWSDTTEYKALSRRCAKWAQDHRHDLALVDLEAIPNMPALDNDRAIDNWAIMIAIADTAGPEWGRRIRNAAEYIENDKHVVLNVHEELLSDIRDKLEDWDKDAIKSKELCDLLNDDQHLRWHRSANGSRPEMSVHAMCGMLKQFDIETKKFRSHSYSGASIRGFHITDFEASFDLYLTPKTTDGNRANGGC